MPFISYRNEDCADLLDDRCDCGNNFPLMTLNVARVSDNFAMPDGRVVHGEFFHAPDYGSEGIITFQFHQTRATRLRSGWCLVPVRLMRESGRLQAAVDQITALTPLPVTVDVRETDAIPLSNAGKHRFTRSDVR